MVVAPGAPGEDLEEGEIAGMFWCGGAEGLDVGSLEQLGEDVCVGSGNGLRDQIDGGTRRCGGFGEEDIGFQGIESFLLGRVHGSAGDV